MRQNEETLFRDWHWSECLENLDNVIQHSDNIILISGDAVSGKTSLKQELINLLAPHFKIFSMYGDPRLGVTTLIRQVTTGFGLPWDNNLAPDWRELQKAIFSQPNCRWILVIDDAEKLSWDSLNSLMRLYTIVSSEGSQFSLILCADFSLENSLRKSVLKDFLESKFQIINLKPLTYEQMVAFLRSIDLTFDHKELKKIYNASGGIIGKIKQLATSELNLKNTGENMIFKNLLQNIISPPVIRVTICCSLLVVAYVLFGFIQKKDNLQRVAEPVVESSKPIQLAKVIEEPQPMETLTPTEIPKTETVATENNLHKIQYEELYQQLYADLKNNLQEHIQSELSKLGAANLENIDKLERKIAELKLPIIENTTVKIVNTATAEKNLLNIAKNRYTLQLMASKNEQTVKKLITNPILNGKAKYFLGKFNPQQENTWFVVVYGSYANKELALNDMKNLPVEIKNLKPIVRNYGSIHQLINNKSQKK